MVLKLRAYYTQQEEHPLPGRGEERLTVEEILEQFRDQYDCLITSASQDVRNIVIQRPAIFEPLGGVHMYVISFLLCVCLLPLQVGACLDGMHEWVMKTLKTLPSSWEFFSNSVLLTLEQLREKYQRSELEDATEIKE